MVFDCNMKINHINMIKRGIVIKLLSLTNKCFHLPGGPQFLKIN